MDYVFNSIDIETTPESTGVTPPTVENTTDSLNGSGSEYRLIVFHATCASKSEPITCRWFKTTTCVFFSLLNFV